MNRCIIENMGSIVKISVIVSMKAVIFLRISQKLYANSCCMDIVFFIRHTCYLKLAWCF